MSDFYKFPTTPYINTNVNISHLDKILSNEMVCKILDRPITVEEKIDGANLGVSFSSNGDIILQNRGSYLLSPLRGQWFPLSNWIKLHEDSLFDVLSDQLILFGEWCYAKHSIYYNRLPDWFIAFDIFDKKEKRFFSVSRRDKIITKLHLAKVPFITNGIFTLDQLLLYKSFISKYSTELCEGIYIRQDHNDWLDYRAKLVNSDFSQSIGSHWSKSNLITNQLAYNMDNPIE